MIVHRLKSDDPVFVELAAFAVGHPNLLASGTDDLHTLFGR